MILIRITQSLLASIQNDLGRPHVFAAERVGFIKAKPAMLENNGLLLVGFAYEPVRDEHYSDDKRFGALINNSGISKALQTAYNEQVCMLHVHQHDHFGKPGFSRIDLRENAQFIPNFFNVAPRFPHGAIVLSKNSATGHVWHSAVSAPNFVDKFEFLGAPIVQVSLAKP